jgi:hypothetical protein
MGDGGPAFLSGRSIDEGMYLRDYFANGPMTEAEFETLREAYSAKFPGQPLSIGRMRYWRAETMLEAREQWYNEHQTPAPVVAAAVFEEAIKPPQEVEGEEMK